MRSIEGTQDLIHVRGGKRKGVDGIQGRLL